MLFFKKPKSIPLSASVINTNDARELSRLKDQVSAAYANLNYVTEPALIDSWIYEINAASLRYESYLNHVKNGTD
ncbi:MAG: DUF2508 domain-containing protein [Lachnospiraceae bacterium]